MEILLRWLVSALAVLVPAYALPGVGVSGFNAALVVALVLGLLNAIIKPIFSFTYLAYQYFNSRVIYVSH